MNEVGSLAVAEVVLDQGVDTTLDYAIPQSLRSQYLAGMRVNVPVKNGIRSGTIVSLKESSPFGKLKEIAGLIGEQPLIPKELFALAHWMSGYYAAPLRLVIRSILPPTVRDTAEKTQLMVKSAIPKQELLEKCTSCRTTHPKWALVLDALLAKPSGVLLSELLEQAKISRSPIDSLEKKGWISCKPVAVDRSDFEAEDFFQTSAKVLSEEQKQAFETITTAIQSEKFSPFLLHGVTGSGKTEVYMQVMEKTLALGKGVILLVPEIALTAQTIERLKSRFQEKIAIVHCRLSDGERRDAWHNLASGKVSIVVGARSALFSPLPNLGLIIVDEEQENSYKQTDEAPCYHARDVAVMRAKLSNATIVLGSATPSLESYANAMSGKYKLLTLNERPKGVQMPDVHLIDMRHEYEKKGFTLFSDKLLDGMKKRLALGEQTILFLNRRGYNSTLLCTECGESVMCPHCDVTLTFHRQENKIACHLCKYELSPPPRECPSCHADATMKYQGIGTEQVERMMHAIFPQARTLRLDADTTKHKGSHEQLFRAFRSGKADILIGTQMIAKGLHFPLVTLVGVLSADSTLNIPDFRSSENVFQLITQVSGRSGRGDLKGEVVVQTHTPESTVMQLAKTGDYIGFYQHEIESRKLFTYPPFTHFIKILFTSEKEEALQEYGKWIEAKLIEKLPPSYTVHPLGPCGYAKIKDKYRYQLLIRGEKASFLAHLTSNLLQHYPPPRNIRLNIDVDPISTYF